ncbi:amidohydrolase domain-containing protein [Sarocladium implicatum]|nr:amidohydrolase domain-containing protein [Sarocladium implicatum]
MDALGIQKSILSVTAPGVHLDPEDDALAQRLAREANLFMAQTVKDYPDRFGFFATLPLPSCEAAIVEAEFALDQLKADGIGLLTNNHGTYLGDAEFDQVFEKLNAMSANIFLHPTPCRYQPCSQGHVSVTEPMPSLPGSILEYMFDTTRAVTNLLLSGTISRNANLSFIVPHCGAVIPATLARSTEFAARALHRPGTLRLEEARELLKTRFYFDLAGWACADQLPALLRVTTPDRLLYGSDLPFTPVEVARDLIEELNESLREFCGEKQAKRVYRENALRLLGAMK